MDSYQHSPWVSAKGVLDVGALLKRVKARAESRFALAAILEECC